MQCLPAIGVPPAPADRCSRRTAAKSPIDLAVSTAATADAVDPDLATAPATTRKKRLRETGGRP